MTGEIAAHPDSALRVAGRVGSLDERIDSAPHDQVMDSLADYVALRSTLIETAAVEPPALQSNTADYSVISMGELIDAEAVTLHEAPPTVLSETGATPMLSAKDIRLGRTPSRLGDADARGAVSVREGDVAVVIGTEMAVRVCTTDGVLLGPGIHLVRANSKAVDPYFLAGVLHAAAEGNHVDLYQVSVPRIPLAEQREYGAAFAQLAALETAWQQRRSTMEHLIRAGFRGLAQGRLRPATGAE
ncbi:hypothetical protein OHB26_38480 [Nocardia sp. NBC_01503]|uniref:hypothetical protein n=1 Tax=Nocardia sp. NBC_01503 TaxID=2975997 RepID=UPI002E7C2635|nr:hypothetical protein [Nocardia sp. NBC_01503]WTL32666.1 hypothetical protein OHB26_38480 [Nocardia sp. NBC_01503]